MKVKRANYPGWNNRHTYRVRTAPDWWEVCQWMYQNQVEHSLLSSGSNGYTFQVRDRQAWFDLKWIQE